MIDIIIKWGLPVLLSAILGFLIKSRNEDKSIKRSMVSLLRSQIVGKCEEYIERGYLPDYARFCLTDLFENYENLGGNHGVKNLVEQCYKLPPKIIKKRGIK